MPKKNRVRLALVTSPLTLGERYGAFAGSGSSQPSFALVCLAAVAQETGAEVCIIDASADNLDVLHAVEALIPAAPDIVGISSTTAGIVASAQLADELKRRFPNIRVIIGGNHVTALPVETMTEFDGFDLAVIGEGEVTLKELLLQYASFGELPSGLDGTVIRENGTVRLNSPRTVIPDLDVLPLPAWNLLSGFPEKYPPSPARVKRVPCASVVLTRGCPNRCNFCDRSVFGNKVRTYSPEYAVNLFRDLRRNYGVKEILIEDDTFFTSRTWLSEFCGRLIEEKLDVTWSCLGRADRVSSEMLHLLRKAGCWHISFGIESGDPEMLLGMNKGETLRQMEQAVRLCREAGIRTKGFFILGYPGETPETIARTREFILRIRLDDISLMFFTPFPGSMVYATARDHGTFERDWKKMNTLESVFIPHGLSVGELREARADIFRSFYFRPSVLGKKAREMLFRPRIWKRMFGSLKTLLKVSHS